MATPFSWRPLLVQVKSTAGGPYKRFDPKDRTELRALAGWTRPHGCGPAARSWATPAITGCSTSSARRACPAPAIPEATEELAQELGLVWWLDRTYKEAIEL